MSRSLTIFFTISCIILLSFKDTLSIVHTLLHKIPNPFHTHHYHHHGHHHHNHGDQNEHSAHDHHHADLTSPHDSESHHDHAALTDDIDNHDLMDHIGGEFKKRNSSEGEGKKKENKQSFKVNWYAGRFYEYDFCHPPILSSLYNSLNCFTFFSRYQTPLSPPPETLFLFI